MLRWAFWLPLASTLLAQNGSLDPAFAKIPFDQWLAENQRSSLRWNADIPTPVLSFHQRLMAHFAADIDGLELANRRGRGELVIFVQLTDAQGRVYQNHGAISLGKLEEGAKSSRFVYTQTAFVLPGEYGVAMALFDTATQDHSVRKEKLHVVGLRRDPWPDAWRDLPAVEFVDRTEGVDDWFLPSVRGRLRLSLDATRPVTVDVLANLTASEDSPSGGVRVNNLRMMIPTLKVLSQADRPNTMLNLSLLDLARRRVTLHQEKVRELDWPAMRDALAETGTSTIDVSSLEHRGEEAAFFVKQVGRRIEQADADGSRCVVVILSGVMAFGSGENLEPIGGRLGAFRVFYIRFHAPRARTEIPSRGNFGRRRGWDPHGGSGADPYAPRADQLEGTLKPLNPKVFDVETAEQTRAALAEIWSQAANE